MAKRKPISIRDLRTLLVRIIQEIGEDRVFGLSAEVAFFWLFALPPTLLAILGAVGYVGDALGPGLTQRVIKLVVSASESLVTPEAAAELIEPTIRSLLTKGRADVFSIGVVFAFWSASRSASVLIDTLTVAYDLELRWTPWRRRILALVFTIGGILFVAILLPILVAGPRLGTALVEPLGLASSFATAWRIVYWPFVGVISVGSLSVVYHYAIPWRLPFKRSLPGAFLALALWLLAATGLRAYAQWTVVSSSLYGSLAAPMVLLLWLYFTAFAVLMGAELNAEIEKLWPSGDRVRWRKGAVAGGAWQSDTVKLAKRLVAGSRRLRDRVRTSTRPLPLAGEEQPAADELSDD